MTLTYDHLTDTDLQAIQRRRSTAHAVLAGALDPDEDHDAAELALQDVVRLDVPRLLLELEQRHISSDEGYVRGLRAAARWLAAFNQTLPGFHRATVHQLAAGMKAMADSAQQRLGVDPDRADDADEAAAYRAVTFR